MNDYHVVFGAGGGAGQGVVRALVERGKNVRAVTRRGDGAFPEGVERVRGDASDSESARQVCVGARVVYHCINVPYAQWERQLPSIMENIIAAAGAAGATLVYCDNLYMYGPVREPMHEKTPLAATTRKGKIRIRLTDQLFQAHKDDRVKAVVGRASDFFGPGAENTVAGQLVFPAVIKGKRAHWLGSLDAPHSMNYIDDVGRALFLLGMHEDTWGEIWHLPAPPPVTGREFIEMAFEVAGRSPKVGLYTRWMMRLVGLFSAQMREILEVFYQFEHPFVLDTRKFTRRFDAFPVTPIREGIDHTLHWEESRMHSVAST